MRENLKSGQNVLTLRLKVLTLLSWVEMHTYTQAHIKVSNARLCVCYLKYLVTLMITFSFTLQAKFSSKFNPSHTNTGHVYEV